jgi:hypothetical protein
MNKNQHRRLRSIQYWQSIESGQKFLINNRENFLMIARELGKSLETIRSDVASITERNACSKSFVIELLKPRKKNLSQLQKKGPSKMTPQQRQEQRAAIDKYWADLERIDSIPASEMVRSAQSAGRSRDDIQRDLQTLKRINRR